MCVAINIVPLIGQENNPKNCLKNRCKTGSRVGNLAEWKGKLSFICAMAANLYKPVILNERSESKDLRTGIILKGIESA